MFNKTYGIQIYTYIKSSLAAVVVVKQHECMQITQKTIVHNLIVSMC